MVLPPGVIKREGQHYVSTAAITNAPGITFLWVRTFPFGFYAPAVLPCLCAFLVTAVEAIGDITATEEASRIKTQGKIHQGRIQGGLLGDGELCWCACMVCCCSLVGHGSWKLLYMCCSLSGLSWVVALT